MPATSPAELHQMFRSAANAHDLHGLLALYESDPVVAEADGGVSNGTPALTAHLRALLARRPQFTSVKTTKQFQTDDIALICSDWTANATAPDGTPIHMAGQGTEVVRRQADGTWLMVIDNPWGTA